MSNNIEKELRKYYRATADDLLIPQMQFKDLVETESSSRAAALPTRPRRALLMAASLVLVVLAVGAIALREHPKQTESPATEPPAIVPPATTLPATTLPATTQPTIASMRPLRLPTAPTGMAIAGQVIRPGGTADVQSAVVVKRDQLNNVIERVTIRVGHISLYAGAIVRTVTIPPNLPNATLGEVVFDRSSESVILQFATVHGNLLLQANHFDEQTNDALSDEMEKIAATLQIGDGADIGIASTLPDGWTLVAVGPEPWENGSFFQGIEIDSADGGARISVDNWSGNGDSYPYWAMQQTLGPVNVRGHAGFVSKFQSRGYVSPTAPESTFYATILIWEEAPGHWVTLWCADSTTDEAVALAADLVAVDQNQWQADGSTSAPSTTVLPESTVLP